MRPVLSREQSRAFDRHAIERCGVPGVLLMENAGRGACEAMLAHLRESRGLSVEGLRVLLVCGAGNNGGDGFVVARRLLLLRAHPEVVLLGRVNDLRGDAALNAKAFLGLGGAIAELVQSDLSELFSGLSRCQVVVDAIFGTGLSRELEGLPRSAVDAINESAKPCVALDVPSGLDADTGSVLGTCTRPELTVTFAHPKLGLMTNTGAGHAGRVVVADIGVPAELSAETGHSAWCVERSDVGAWLKQRASARHKGDAGRVVVVAGSPGKVGAAQLVARGALRAGAGLVTVASFPEVTGAIEANAWEVMTLAVENGNWEALTQLLTAADAVVLGPGLGTDERARTLAQHVLASSKQCLVVDADALTHFAGRAYELSASSAQLILTPHPGEAARLLGVSSKQIEADRFGALHVLVEQTGATVLLKGQRTLVGAPKHKALVNTSGNSALATAGSGDVLAGIIAAFSCSLSPQEAAICGAWIHGTAAEEWSRQSGGARGLLAREIAESLPRVLAEF